MKQNNTKTQDTEIEISQEKTKIDLINDYLSK